MFSPTGYVAKYQLLSGTIFKLPVVDILADEARVLLPHGRPLIAAEVARYEGAQVAFLGVFPLGE